MAKLIKCETVYSYYVVELTEEQRELFQNDNDQFWDDFWNNFDDSEWEFVRDKVGDTDYYYTEE